MLFGVGGHNSLLWSPEPGCKATQARCPAPLPCRNSAPGVCIAGASLLAKLCCPCSSLCSATLGGLLGGGGGSVQPSQRISPYLSKQPPRPASAPKPRTPASTGKFRERALASEVLAVLNPHVAAPAEVRLEQGLPTGLRVAAQQGNDWSSSCCASMGGGNAGSVSAGTLQIVSQPSPS